MGHKEISNQLQQELMEREFNACFEKIVKVIKSVKKNETIPDIKKWSYKALDFICYKYDKEDTELKKILEKTWEEKIKEMEQNKNVNGSKVSEQKEMFV